MIGKQYDAKSSPQHTHIPWNQQNTTHYNENTTVSHMKILISHQQKHIHTFRLEGYVSFAVAQIMAKIVKNRRPQDFEAESPEGPAQ